ncbi:MAG: nucleotide pyrophosphohydrolase [Proteobacteria bacterium]|nr:nucleotide pyrophosphohydrolase [Pseudomonadota bacterium]MBU1232600.1 nucleotide pyrophosphohydrolase [Pseudomonadota bacterium]MBU1417041.1 nucleotide pyrophosphohydrolase [Pseudomonadota bacterium]MBU1453737.1 nucleotide pyrophosphohydrolase [Pseudomonadota bacterium]
MTSNKNIFLLFCKTISSLRAKNGCPWDQKQTVKSLKKYIQEECDELLEAMDGDDPAHLCEEIGDVLFLLVLLSEISSESGHFTIDEVITGIKDKMIRRHPHVFGDADVGSDEELREQWEKIKSQEKAQKTN